MRYPNGETYVGNWSMNVREGQGKLTKENGDVIEVKFYFIKGRIQ